MQDLKDEIKDEIMDEDSDRQETINEIQLVSFKIKDEEFGIPIEDVQEIIRMSEITKLPGTRTFIEGVIDLRGQILPVIDLRKKLNLNDVTDFTPSTRIDVIAVDGIETGMIVDNVSEVLRVSKESVKNPPSLLGEDKEYLTGIVRFDSRLIILLNVKKIITKEDIVHISEITKRISDESIDKKDLEDTEDMEDARNVKTSTHLCKGRNPDGSKCKRPAIKGSDYCEIHQPS